MSDEWGWYRKEQQARREKRLPIRTEAILALRKQGYAVEQKTVYHFRVNGVLDLYPIHNRWFDLRTKERGGAKDLATFVKERIRHFETRDSLTEEPVAHNHGDAGSTPAPATTHEGAHDDGR